MEVLVADRHKESAPEGSIYSTGILGSTMKGNAMLQLLGREGIKIKPCNPQKLQICLILCLFSRKQDSYLSRSMLLSIRVYSFTK